MLCRARPVALLSKRSKITVAFENKDAKYGTGVFTKQKVSKGDVVWRFDEKDCIRFVTVTVFSYEQAGPTPETKCFLNCILACGS